MESFKTQRLSFQRPNLSDLNDFHEIESDAESVRFTTFKVPQTLEQTRVRLNRDIADLEKQKPFGYWVGRDKKTKQFICYVLLFKKRYEFWELGYMVHRNYWGQGYATEACQQVLINAFELSDIKKIVACTDLDNKASQRVLTKLGFQTFRDEDRLEGMGPDLEAFYLIKK